MDDDEVPLQPPRAKAKATQCCVLLRSLRGSLMRVAEHHDAQ